MGRIVSDGEDVEVETSNVVDLHPLSDLPDASEQVNRGIVDLTEDGSHIEGDFYISKSGFGKDGETWVTIVFPRRDRDVCLSLVDMEGRMVHGEFAKPEQRRKTSTEEDIQAWYELHFGDE